MKRKPLASFSFTIPLSKKMKESKSITPQTINLRPSSWLLTSPFLPQSLDLRMKVSSWSRKCANQGLFQPWADNPSLLFFDLVQGAPSFFSITSLTLPRSRGAVDIDDDGVDNGGGVADDSHDDDDLVQGAEEHKLEEQPSTISQGRDVTSSGWLFSLFLIQVCMGTSLV